MKGSFLSKAFFLFLVGVNGIAFALPMAPAPVATAETDQNNNGFTYAELRFDDAVSLLEGNIIQVRDCRTSNVYPLERGVDCTVDYLAQQQVMTHSPSLYRGRSWNSLTSEQQLDRASQENEIARYKEQMDRHTIEGLTELSRIAGQAIKKYTISYHAQCYNNRNEDCPDISATMVDNKTVCGYDMSTSRGPWCTQGR